jgi:hypothetical protein
MVRTCPARTHRSTHHPSPPLLCPAAALCAVQIVLHPRWGSAVYPATLFTKAPLQELLDAVKEAEALLQGTGLSQP